MTDPDFAGAVLPIKGTIFHHSIEAALVVEVQVTEYHP
jgi:hypothetical protein